MTLKASVSWLGDEGFIARAPDGPAIVLDAADGTSGPKPLELLLMSVAGCSAVHVLAFLRERRSPITSFRANISAERADTTPRRLTKITIEYIFNGDDIDPNDVEEAICMSERNLCSAIASLNAECTSRFEIAKGA